MNRASTRPRVLMVVGAYYPELAGGSLQCRTLVGALKDRVDFSVFTTTASRTLPASSEVDGVPVQRVFVDVARPSTKIAAAWTMLRRMPALTRAHDIFHFHGFTEKMLPLIVAAKTAGRRTVEKMTSFGWDDPVSIRTRPHGRWLAAGMARVDRFVAINRAMRDRCVAAGIAEDRIRTIPNGVDTARFAPVDPSVRAAVRRRLDLPEAATIVTFVGFWSGEKGPHRLFDAWRDATARAGGPNVLLYIGSTSPTHAEVDVSLVERVRRQADADRLDVRFVEQTGDVAAYLQASDVFALPSSREGMSNALLEAMAAGLPCVAAAIPGVTESVIDDGVTGRLVAAEDAAGLREAIRAVVTDADLRGRLGRAARAAAVERFSIETVADAYLSLYRELLSA